MKNAILIAGPTASGKSALSLDLAERTGGVIVNTDSMQGYSVLDGLTSVFVGQPLMPRLWAWAVTDEG